MSRLTCRLLPYEVADGPHNMAADETLLEAAVTGTASLRFYGWSAATVSLGYFQPERARHPDPALARLPFVRRPSGGLTLVHHHEVTYAIGLPAGRPWQTGESWLCRMHAVIAAALRPLGVEAGSCGQEKDDVPTSGLCFQKATPGDLLIGPAKVVGSAQRRQRGALLQHGAILLAASPHALVLPGIRELTGRDLSVAEVCRAVGQEFARRLGVDLVASARSADERRRIDELVATRYGQDGWNRKR